MRPIEAPAIKPARALVNAATDPGESTHRCRLDINHSLASIPQPHITEPKDTQQLHAGIESENLAGY